METQIKISPEGIGPNEKLVLHTAANGNLEISREEKVLTLASSSRVFVLLFILLILLLAILGSGKPDNDPQEATTQTTQIAVPR